MGLTDPEWRLFRPAVPCGTSVLLLAGPSIVSALDLRPERSEVQREPE